MHFNTSEQEKLQLGFGDHSCNWGVHMCCLYETEKERDDVIFKYLLQGFKKEDLDLYIYSERSKKDFETKFTAYCPECSKELNNTDNFILSTAKDFYYPEGIFDPLKMEDKLNSFFTETQKGGKRNLRAIAEMAWALETMPGVEHLMVYESRLNNFVEGKPLVSICMYNINKFSGKIIMNALKTHPYTITGGVITQNPYYQKPEIWLRENAPQFLNK
ncbi:MAG: hypothetical protein C0595_13990 [Marinilabiliales bacterium]|nr:MAG: hypothetical protein C0595_13990 [Marinilabiliales bacterium]